MRWLKKTAARFLPGLLLAAVLYAGCTLHSELKNFGSFEQYRDINGFQYAEQAVRKTGLGSAAHDAANTSLYYSTYFRDGESLTVFAVDTSVRDRLMQLIQSTENWRSAVITPQDYQQIARRFRQPASMLIPSEEVVFDAVFYQDIMTSKPDRLEGRCWENLPASLGMEKIPYTTDFRFAFFDQETGLFICYDETM